MTTTETQILRDSHDRPLVALLGGGAFSYSGHRLSAVEGGSAVLRSDYASGAVRFERKPLESCRVFDAAGNLFPVVP